MTDLINKTANTTNVLKQNKTVKSHTEFVYLVEKKLEFYKDVVQKTAIHIQKNKILDILAINEVNMCIEQLKNISLKIADLADQLKKVENQDFIVSGLQTINNELSSVLKNFGTNSLEDLLQICFGNNSNNIANTEYEMLKFELLKKYFHPTSYKLVKDEKDMKQKKQTNDKSDKSDKNDKNNKNDDEYSHFDCFDIGQNSEQKQFHMKVYGLNLYLNNIEFVLR